MTAPTMALSLKHLRARGYYAWNVERKKLVRREGEPTLDDPAPAPTSALISQDLLGLADILALKPGSPPILVQTTARASLSSRREKALTVTVTQPDGILPKGAPNVPRLSLALWLASGGRFHLHGWDQPGGDKTRWRLRAEAAMLTKTAPTAYVARTVSGDAERTWLSFVEIAE